MVYYIVLYPISCFRSTVFMDENIINHIYLVMYPTAIAARHIYMYIYMCLSSSLVFYLVLFGVNLAAPRWVRGVGAAPI